MSDCKQFPFFTLPCDMQIEVLKKLPLNDILSARLGSTALNNLVERYRLSLPYRSFPDVQFHPVMSDSKHMQYEEKTFAKRFMKGEIGGLTISYMEITNDFIASLERAIKRSRIRVYRLGLDYCRISVDAQSFSHLLEVMGIFELSIVHTVTVSNTFTLDLATKPSVRRLERFGILLPTNIDDEYILESKNDWLAVCGTNVTEAAVNRYIKEFVEGKRTFQYLALELPNTIDSANILLDIDFYLDIDNSIHFLNKQGERRSLGISDKCIQIYSDMAIHMIEQHMQQTK
ncbi:unnamed protein product [Cylicocyclus nassatus]|uniref:F-box domain-containing protein n=1 Tax=Cylicocyclus nassatus TaxID=53992 RepID=A0AA36H0J7_CYLNA|nr:unnamed protein product [Cylicocyclus nassatus]